MNVSYFFKKVDNEDFERKSYFNLEGEEGLRK